MMPLRALLIAPLIIFAIVTLLVGCPAGGGDDPFRHNCEQHDGIVASQSHGKSHTYYCIVGRKVIDVE